MRRYVWVILVVVTLLLAACGPAMKPATGEKTETGEMFLIALPRLVIEFDAEGNPSVLGMNLVDAGRLIGQDFSGMKLNKYYIDWMAAANVQHIELRQTGDGMAILSNGKPLPHVAWTDQSLQQATDIAALFNVQGTDVIKRFLPIVRRLGLNVVLRFPLRQGAEAIPLADPNVAMAAAKPDSQPESAIIKFEIKYDDQGVPSILGISARELAAMGVNLPLAMQEGSIRAMQARNVQYMELRTKPDGLYVYVNGSPLPNLVWDNDLLSNAADLYAQMNPTSPYIELAKQLMPTIDNLDIDILMHFPRAAGAEALQIQTH